MERRRIGNTEIEVSAVSLGCWPMGGDYWGGADDEESVRTVHRALELGVNFLDTAPAYGNGHSEEVVGRALEGRRDQAVISTKASGAGHSEEELRRKLRESLDRLRTDYVDVYFLHWPSRGEPLGAAIEALERLRADGMIRAIGVSNFDVGTLEMAAKYGTVDILQPPYNLIWRFIEEDVLPHCVSRGIGVSTYSSLAQGILAGAIRLNTHYPAGDLRPRSVLWKPENLGKCLYTAARLQEISDEVYRSMPYYYDMWENWASWQKRGPQRER